MDCRECTSLIGDFLSDELDNAKLSEFLDHLSGCEECREELSDHYLVTEGLQKLETGGAFDLMGDLERTVSDAKERLRRRIFLLNLAVGMEILTASVFAVVIALVVLY